MLVDGHSVAFRAYYALPASIEDADGEPANALYGFMSILLRVVLDHRPTHRAAAFAPAIAAIRTTPVIFIACLTSAATGGSGQENRPRP